MAYANKQIDHEKRKNCEGSYSPENYMYRYLMDNYEPQQLNDKPSMALESLERKLVDTAKEYLINAGISYATGDLAPMARSVISRFINNNGEHGDTAHNLGKMQNNSFDTVKESISDLRW